MNVLNFLLSASLVTTLAGCDQYSASTSSSGNTSASSSSSADNKEVTLSGTSGLAELAGDKIEIKNGTVFVNDVSFGSVPPGAEVKYTMNSSVRTLIVAGEPRNALR